MLLKIKNFILKYKAIFVSVIIFFLCLLVFATIFLTNVRPNLGKGKSIKINDYYDTVTTDLSTGKISQTFKTTAELHAIGLLFKKSDDARGILTVNVLNDATNEILGTTTIDRVDSLSNVYYSYFYFNTMIPAGTAETYRIETDYKMYSGSLALQKYSTNNLEGATLFENGVQTDGTLAMTAINQRMNDGFIKGFYLAFALLSALFCVFVYLLIFVKKVKIEWLFVAVILFLGIIFNMILPPYSSPDEQFHINQAYAFSNKLLGYPEDYFNNVAKRACDTNELISYEETSVYTYNEIFDNTFKLSPSSEISVIEGATQVDKYMPPYVLSGLAVTVARLLHLGFVPLLYLGRLFNLLFFALLGFFAIKAMPVAKPLIFCFLTMPICLHVGNSFSRDSFIIAVSTFIICRVFSLIYTKRQTSLGELVILAVLACLLVPAKIVYAPLCILLILIPSECFKKPKLIKKLKLVFIVLACGMFAIFSFSTIYTSLTKGATDYIDMSYLIYEDYLVNDPARAVFGLPYIFRHFNRTLVMCISTILNNFAHYLEGIVGGKLSYYSIQISPIFTFLIWGLLLFCSMRTEKQQKLLSPKYKISFAALFACISALVIGGCLLWTPVFAPEIYGIQGRYFLPCLLLLLFCLTNKQVTVSEKSQKLCTFIMPVTCIFVLLNAFTIIMAR